MPLHDLRDRFERVQAMQEDFLTRIRQYRLTKDPLLLPAVTEADRLDDELVDIARELSQSDSDDEAPVRISIDLPPVPNMSRRRISAPVVVTDVQPGVCLDEIPPERSSPVIGPSSNHEDSAVLVDLEYDRSNPQIEASASPSTGGGLRRKRMDSFVVMRDATEAVAKTPVSPGNSGTVIPSFGEVMKHAMDDGELSLSENESSAPETFDEPPPTYRKDDLERPEKRLEIVPTQPVVVLEEPRDLTYISPTPPTSPPPMVAPSRPNFLSPQPEVVSNMLVTQPETISPTMLFSPPVLAQPQVFLPTLLSPGNAPALLSPLERDRNKQSPLGRVNERRKALSDLSSEPAKYWQHVRAERERMESILETLGQLETVQSEIRKDFENLRVRPIGVTGEYLFRKHRKSIAADSSPGVVVAGDDIDRATGGLEVTGSEPAQPIEAPQSTPPAAELVEVVPSSPSGEAHVVTEDGLPSSPSVGVVDMWNSWMGQFTAAPQPPPRELPFKVVWAVAFIQRWYRRWSARRKEKLAWVASIAETEAVAAREALRKRRRDRRQAPTNTYSLPAAGSLDVAQPSPKRATRILDDSLEDDEIIEILE